MWHDTIDHTTTKTRIKRLKALRPGRPRGRPAAKQVLFQSYCVLYTQRRPRHCKHLAENSYFGNTGNQTHYFEIENRVIIGVAAV